MHCLVKMCYPLHKHLFGGRMMGFMSNVAVVTDSNSGITQAQAVMCRVHVLPMPIIINGEQFFEDISITQEMFYEKLMEDTDVRTSQPAIGDVLDCWETLLLEYDELVHIPMSSGLSAAYETAATLARDFGGRVQVVNNQRISVTQRQSALDAVSLSDRGWDANRIKEYLEEIKFDSSIYIMLDTLKYLKKGGRITPAGAAIGTLLNIKPILQINGDKLDAYAKARGTKQAKTVMIDAMKNDFNGRFKEFSGPGHMWLQAAYTYDRAAADEFIKEVEAVFMGYEIHVDPLSLSVSCHIGPGALALACSKKIMV